MREHTKTYRKQKEWNGTGYGGRAVDGDKSQRVKGGRGGRHEGCKKQDT